MRQVGGTSCLRPGAQARRRQRSAYDAWGRVLNVEDGSSHTIAEYRHDGLGRRISKKIENSGDWNCCYHYFLDGNRVIEERAEMDVGEHEPLRVHKQYVWGLTYVDELVQVQVNQDPTDTAEDDYFYGGHCERSFWVAQDANFNVLGVLSDSGLLVERYEYTPYGQRTIFSRNWRITDLNGDGLVDSTDLDIYDAEEGGDAFSIADVNGDGTVDTDDETLLNADNGNDYSLPNDALTSYPVLESARGSGPGTVMPLLSGLCDIGHQGLMLDKEFGLYYNRARYLDPTNGLFMQRDPAGYVDRINLHEYLASAPLSALDPTGLAGVSTTTQPTTQPGSNTTNAWITYLVRKWHIWRTRTNKNPGPGPDIWDEGYPRYAVYAYGAGMDMTARIQLGPDGESTLNNIRITPRTWSTTVNNSKGVAIIKGFVSKTDDLSVVIPRIQKASVENTDNPYGNTLKEAGRCYELYGEIWGFDINDGWDNKPVLGWTVGTPVGSGVSQNFGSSAVTYTQGINLGISVGLKATFPNPPQGWTVPSIPDFWLGVILVADGRRIVMAGGKDLLFKRGSTFDTQWQPNSWDRGITQHRETGGQATSFRSSPGGTMNSLSKTWPADPFPVYYRTNF